MKLHIISDLHIDIDPTFTLPMTDADALIIAGDVCNNSHKNIDSFLYLIRDHLHKPVLFVPGNHEFYDGVMQDVHNLFLSVDDANPNFHYLADRDITIDGIHFIGATLWTNFDYNTSIMKSVQRGLNDYRYIKHYRQSGKPEKGIVKRVVTGQDILALHNKSRNFIETTLDNSSYDKTVVITHHGPSIKSIHPRFMTQFDLNFGFVSRLDSLVEKSTLWIHGHTHDSFYYSIKDAVVLTNPKGYYDENRNFIADLVIEI